MIQAIFYGFQGGTNGNMLKNCQNFSCMHFDTGHFFFEVASSLSILCMDDITKKGGAHIFGHNQHLYSPFLYVLVFVKKGDLEIHISKINHESRILVEEGDITIKMIDTHPLKLTVSTFL